MALEHVRVETGRFQAKGSDGAAYTVIEHTHYMRIAKFPADSTPVMVEGVKELEAWPGGNRVLEVDGQLVIAARGLVLQRV